MEKEDINIRYEHQNNSNYLVIEDSSEYEDYQYKTYTCDGKITFAPVGDGWILDNCNDPIVGWYHCWIPGCRC